jgi:F0F1-type ATP synthase membrane subunit a
MLGIIFCIVVFILLASFIQNFSSARAMIWFDLLYEKVYKFYSDILWKEVGKNIKVYIATLFFVIFFANIAGVLLDFIAPIFWVSPQWEFYLAEYIVMPTADMQFNIALAIFSTLLLIYVQFGTLWYKQFFYNYLPFWGKGYIELERGKMGAIIYYLLFIIAKLWDIIISLFLWFLDMVGLFAKVISLAFRLFGNITSGTILLWMLLVWVSSFSQSMTSFMWGINFPIILPLLVYAQWLLVAVIQAMVFPLLVAIFIRMAMVETA